MESASMATACITIIIGVTVYCVSQIIEKFIIDPIHRQREVIGEIADAIVFYANVICSPGSNKNAVMDEVQQKLRRLATMLQSLSEMIPYYKIFDELKVVANVKAVADVSKELIYLSNSIHDRPENVEDKKVSRNSASIEKIKRWLNLKINC